MILLLVGAAPDATARSDGSVRSVWHLVAVPNPHGAPIDAYVGALDCPTADYCVIISGGTYLTTLSGHSVRTIRAPVYVHDPHYSSGLVDVSCAVPGTCVATGDYTQGQCCGSAGYRDVLADGTWTAEYGTEAWEDVACNPNRCVEVGTADIGIDLAVIDDQDAGGEWTQRQVVTPFRDDGEYAIIDSVTCPRSGGHCYAVGYGGDAPEPVGGPLFFSRDGDVWRGVLQALPAGADEMRSHGVRHLTCPSAGNCRGLGTYVDAATGTTQLFLETLTDGALSAQPVHAPSSLDAFALSQVNLSCVTMTSCAGTVGGSVLLRFVDGRWTQQSARLPADAIAGSSTYLAATSCASRKLCVAVGSYEIADVTPPTYRSAVWIRSAGRWHVRALGTPKGVGTGPDDNVIVTDVQCAATRCTLVGSTDEHPFYGIGHFTG